jgi:hypothetical protein
MAEVMAEMMAESGPVILFQLNSFTHFPNNITPLVLLQCQNGQIPCSEIPPANSLYVFR